MANENIYPPFHSPLGRPLKFTPQQLAEKEAAEKPVSLPATAMKAQKVSKPTPAKRKAVKAKK